MTGRERGSAAVELIGMLPLLLLVALLLWQGLLTLGATNAAEHAARNGSRAASTGGSARSAAMDAVPTWLRDDTAVQRDGGTDVTVRISVPLLVPGVAPAYTVTRTAVLPRTG